MSGLRNIEHGPCQHRLRGDHDALEHHVLVEMEFWKTVYIFGFYVRVLILRNSQTGLRL